jgi:hypothetical protein
MKQLLHHFHNERCNNSSSSSSSNRSSSYFVVGLHNRAFVGRLDTNDNNNNNDKSVSSCQPVVIELQKPILAIATGAATTTTKKKTSKTADGSGTKKTSDRTQQESKDENEDELDADADENVAVMAHDDNDLEDNEENDVEQEQKTARRTNRNPAESRVVDPWQIQAVVGTIDYFPKQQQQQHQPSSADELAEAAPAPPQLLFIIVAVSYYNKTLAIYRLDMSDLLGNADAAAAAAPTTTPHIKIVAPITVYHTSKRVSSLCFARVPPPPPPGRQQHQQPSIVVVVTGDLAGDAFAYSLTDKDHQYQDDATLSKSNGHRHGIDNGGVQDDTTNAAGQEMPKLPALTLAAALKESPEEITCCSFRRLLLGHTASMLTAVECTRTTNNGNNGNYDNELLILTADRDEKIRVSSFPNTHEVQGYLLGHSAFISSMAIVKNNKTTTNRDNSNNSSDSSKCKNNDASMNIVVSCGGDCFLRVWDYQKCIELASLDLSSLNSSELQVSGIPIKVAAVLANDDHDDDELPQSRLLSRLLLNVIVIYDDSKNMHGLQVSLPFDSSNSSNDADTNDTATTNARPTAAATIRDVVQISLPAPPLSVSMLSSSQVLVLMRDPEYLQVYNIPLAAATNDSLNNTTPSGSSSNPACRLLQDVAQLACLQLPNTILEKDKFGNYKMQKNNEKRGPAHQLPWNNARRRETAREQTRRARKNRNSRKRQKTTTSSSSSNNNNKGNTPMSSDGDDKA